MDGYLFSYTFSVDAKWQDSEGFGISQEIYHILTFGSYLGGRCLESFLGSYCYLLRCFSSSLLIDENRRLFATAAIIRQLYEQKGI